MRGLVNRDGKLSLSETLEVPTPSNNELKIKVHYAALNPTDLDMASGKYDLLLFLAGVRSGVRTGFEYSGIVLEGAGVFREDTRVFGYTNLFRGPKTHQEIVCLDPTFAALVPDEMTLKQAASLPVGGMTAQYAWHQLARVRSGDHVLINGGSGGVGIYAIQLAKALGANVVAVAGPSGAKLMQQLGADRVVNYETEDIRDIDLRFDAILDLTCRLRFKNIQHILAQNGTFIPADPTKNLGDFLRNLWSSKKTRYLMVDRGEQKKMMELVTLFNRKKIEIPEGSVFKVENIEAAIDRLRKPGVPGRLLLHFD